MSTHVWIARTAAAIALVALLAGAGPARADKYCSEAAGNECEAAEEILPGSSQGQDDYTGSNTETGTSTDTGTDTASGDEE